VNEPDTPEIIQLLMASFSDSDKNDLMDMQDEADDVSMLLKQIADDRKSGEKDKKKSRNVPKPKK